MSHIELKKHHYIDALRGVAILGVILVHSSQLVAPASAALRQLMAEGALGVQLFYVASALTLYMSWQARSPQEVSPVRNFYIRRFFRIAPMFYLAIAGSLAVRGLAPSYWAPNGIEWWFFPITASFLHGFHPETINSVVPGGWSIAVEMTFYLLLPLLMPYMRTLRSSLVMLTAAFALYAFNVFMVPRLFSYPEHHQYLVDNFVMFNLLGQMPVFILGMLCYLLLRAELSRVMILRIATMGTAILLSLLWLSYTTVAWLPRHILAGGIFAMMVLVLANWPIRAVVNRVTTTLGKLSYSMYLMHFAVIMALSKLGMADRLPSSDLVSALFFVGIVLATAAVSYFCYHFVEKPGIAMGRRIIDRLEDKASANYKPLPESNVSS